MSISRLLSLLVVLALLVAPVAMLGGMAKAMPQAAAAGHCADMNQPADEHPVANVDCMMACAALPALAEPWVPTAALVAPVQPLPRRAQPAGLAPEAETPPPRFF